MSLQAVRIRRTIDSETLTLPELRPWIGRSVVILVVEDEATSPAPPVATAAYDEFFSLAGQDLVDPDAYKRLRAASPTQ